ncbi:MAG: YIP1 family protein [Candidatus Sumerlaeaceae bacterium]|nr:YIP1 family protein [Candidatus Sumerlaeaceae bacterium]
MTPSPFRTIWTSPRETIRRIVANDPEFYVIFLTCLVGIQGSLDRASARSLGDKWPVPFIIGLACTAGPVGSLLSLWLFSHLIRWTGRWLGGTAIREHIRTAIAWGYVPVVFSLPLWIPELALFGSELFTEETPRLDSQPELLISFLAFCAVEVVLGLWALVLFCNTIAEVQGFRSAWAGLGNFCLAVAVVIVPVILLAVTFLALKKP